MNRRSVLKKTGLFAGATIAMPSILSLLQSCEEETRLTWNPVFFTQEEATTIATLVDMILPRTDTPGALDVKVDVFIDKVVALGYDEAGQLDMRNQIANFNADCTRKFGAIFINLTEDNKVNVLTEHEKSSGSFNQGVWGKTIGEQEPIGFYRSLKSMAIWAYTTSEEIGKNVLSYDPIPGQYLACIPVTDVGNKWSL